MSKIVADNLKVKSIAVINSMTVYPDKLDRVFKNKKNAYNKTHGIERAGFNGYSKFVARIKVWW